MAAKYGYINLQGFKANEQELVEQLKEYVTGKKIYIDRDFGKDIAQPQLDELIAKLKPGDHIYSPKLSGLAPSFPGLVKLWDELTLSKGIEIHVLELEKGLGYAQENQRYLVELFGKLNAEFIRKNQAKGMARARESGRAWGAPTLERPKNYEEVRELWQNGSLSSRKAAAKLGIAPATFKNWVEADNVGRDESEENRLTKLYSKYPEGVPDEMWEKLRAVLYQKMEENGRRPRQGRKEVVDYVLYKFGNDCAWANLPLEDGKWWSVYSCYANWKDTGVLKKLLDVMEEE